MLHGVLPKLLQTKEAILNSAEFPLPEYQKQLEQNIAISQFRHRASDFVNDPLTWLAYPVFDSFGDDRTVAGVLATNINWGLFFGDSLLDTARGYICVIENSYNQTFSYRVDGPRATFLGELDRHDPNYDHLVQSADINEFVQDRAGPESRSYTTVPLNKEFGKYRLKIYPTRDTEDEFYTNKPWVYTAVVLSVFLVTSIILIVLDRIVARRQRIVMERLVKAAQETAAFEHELNAFLAHEVRKYVHTVLSSS